MDFQFSKSLTGSIATEPWQIIPDDIDDLDFEIVIPSAGEAYFEVTRAKTQDVNLDSPVGSVASVAAFKWPNGNVTANSFDTYQGALSAFRIVNVSGTCIFNVRGNKV